MKSQPCSACIESLLHMCPMVKKGWRWKPGAAEQTPPPPNSWKPCSSLVGESHLLMLSSSHSLPHILIFSWLYSNCTATALERPGPECARVLEKCIHCVRGFSRPPACRADMLRWTSGPSSGLGERTLQERWQTFQEAAYIFYCFWAQTQSWVCPSLPVELKVHISLCPSNQFFLLWSWTKQGVAHCQNFLLNSLLFCKNVGQLTVFTQKLWKPVL